MLDMVKVKRALDGSKSRLIGPNCPGVLTPNECKIGIMPGNIFKAGPRRHRLALGHAHLRGGEADHGRRARPVDRGRHRRRSRQGHRVHRRAGAVPRRPGDRFHHHDRRDRRLGRGGRRRVHQERGEAGRAKPMAGFIAGVTAPPGRRMGHAGAIISGGKGKAADKLDAMRSRRHRHRASPAALGTTLMDVLKGQSRHAKVAE